MIFLENTEAFEKEAKKHIEIKKIIKFLKNVSRYLNSHEKIKGEKLSTNLPPTF